VISGLDPLLLRQESLALPHAVDDTPSFTMYQVQLGQVVELALYLTVCRAHSGCPSHNGVNPIS